MSELPSSLSSQDVCAILKSCRQNQVVKLSFAGLTVEFLSPGGGVEPQSLPRNAVKAPKLTDVTVELGEREQQVLSHEDRLDLLAVTDPLAYEQFINSEDAERRDEDDSI